MKSLLTLLSMAVTVLASAQVAGADLIDWADDVEEYSLKIQNYGGTLMTAATEFWVTGAPDADVDGNGYAWDDGDSDYVAGWRANAPDEYLVVHFDTALADIAGDDLSIHLYGGPEAGATVSASTDGISYDEIGTLGGGEVGYLRNERFDFNGLFSSGVRYVKVQRIENGSKTGMFFDAFGGTAVPEPAAVALLLTAAGFLAVWWRIRS